MRLRIRTIFGMVLIIYGASIVGRVVKVITLDKSISKENVLTEDKLKIGTNFELRSNLSNNIDNIFWFIQISDLHISIFHDKSRINQLQQFVNSTIEIIEPSVVLASGDLTDAKLKDNLGSKQSIDEWIIYQDLLQKYKVSEKTVWLDIRGNHDNFDVPSLNSSNNYYQKYSIQGKRHQRSYMYNYRKGEILISFIGVDACLLPGPKRPFNFIGVLTSKEMEALSAFKEESLQSNYTIWFGHYPTSCIISPDQGLRKLMTGSLAYLCGHLHTLSGYVENLYTRQQTGSLELELGDWKDNRIFRVAAIDNGMFSFADVRINEWPVIVVTNPKNALFTSPRNEPLHRMGLSSHVRVLVWSENEITEVKMRFNRGFSWSPMKHIDGPLYAASWQPHLYEEGIHILEILAEDTNGMRNLVSQPFSLDGSQPDFNFVNRIILMSNVSLVVSKRYKWRKKE